MHEHAHAVPDQAMENPDLETAGDTPPATHPLDPLSAEEIERARDVLVAAGLLGESVRVPMLLPAEPDKKAVATWHPGDPLDRRADVTLLDTATGEVTEAIVAITAGEVVSSRRYASDTAP